MHDAVADVFGNPGIVAKDVDIGEQDCVERLLIFWEFIAVCAGDRSSYTQSEVASTPVLDEVYEQSAGILEDLENTDIQVHRRL